MCQSNVEPKFDARSINISLWKDISQKIRYENTDLISVGDWIYVIFDQAALSETCHEPVFPLDYFDSVIVTPIPRQEYRTSLLTTRETVSDIGKLSELQVDVFEEVSSKRGFHFRVVEEAFDFRKFKEQGIVKVEVKAVLNMSQMGSDSPSSSFQVEKNVYLRIVNFSDQDPEKVVRSVPRRYIVSDSYYFKKLFELPTAGKHPYRITEDERAANIFWFHLYDAAADLVEDIPIGEGGYIATNHLMSQYDIGLKDGLTRTLRRNLSVTSKFYPTTHLLSNENELNDFFSHLMSYNDKEEEIWILKPSHYSEGRGIKLLSKSSGGKIKINEMEIQNLEEFKKHVFEYKGKEIEYICQKYIPNPLLYNGYKVGFRQYWLVPSIKPLRVLLYKTGHCTFGSTPYKKNMKHLDDLTMHLTNYDQQPEGEEPELIYVKQFAKYLDDDTWFENTFKKQVKHVLTNIVHCYNESILDYHGREDILTFGFFALDFIMDENHVLWLNEVQMSPSLKFTDETCKKREYTPKMMIEAMNIVTEVQRFARKNHGSTYGLKEFRGRKKFEWIINDTI